LENVFRAVLAGEAFTTEDRRFQKVSFRDFCMMPEEEMYNFFVKDSEDRFITSRFQILEYMEMVEFILV
jgi:hypothetical protein